MKKVLDKMINIFIIFSLLFIEIVVVVGVFSRYILGQPIMGTEAVSRLGFIWLTFIGMAAVTRDHEHIRVTYFMDKLPKKAKSISEQVIDTIIIIFSVIVIKTSFSFMNIQKGIITSSIGLPRTAFTLAIPIGLTLAVFYYVLQFKKSKK